MGLLEQIYSVFSLTYSSILAAREHEHFSRADWAFIGASIAFVGLSIVRFLNQLRVIPWRYKLRFIGKTLARGVLAPLLPLLYYPLLFYSKGWVKRALTFSNEAYDGVERTRQLHKYELVEFGSPGGRYLAIHDLFWYEEEQRWGYNRLVGEIWVKVRFEALFDVDRTRRLQTRDTGDWLLLQYEPRDGELPEERYRIETRRVFDPVHECVKVSCLNCVCEDLESARPRGSGPRREAQRLPDPLPALPEQFAVTITRRRTICRLQRCCLFTGYTWSLSSTVIQRWTLFQIHQYMVCLDAWRNHPKQGIWKPSTRLFRYCYRHNELIAAIENNMRLKETENRGTWFTVV